MLRRWLAGAALLGLPFWWGEPLDLRVTEATSINDLIDAGRLRSPQLSPDGAYVSWSDNDGLCLFAFESGETTCTAWPEDSDVRTGPYNPPVWSPDSRHIFLHEDFIIRLSDSDLWSFDVETRMFTNLTDDGYDGSLLRVADDATVPLDFGPVFHPLTGDLYWWRIVRDTGGFSFSEARLLLMTWRDGAAVEAHDLSAHVSMPGSVYRPGVFSADGEQLFVQVLPPNPMNDPAGIYALTLADGSFERIASVRDLQAALPDWAEDQYAPVFMQAAANGLVVWLETVGRSSMPLVATPIYVDAATGTATSVIDYSGLDTPEAFVAAREGEVTIFDQPRASYILPDGQTLWVLLTRASDEAALFSATLPPGDSAPEHLTTVDAVVFPDPPAPSTAGGDKLLLVDLLVTFAPAE